MAVNCLPKVKAATMLVKAMTAVRPIIHLSDMDTFSSDFSSCRAGCGACIAIDGFLASASSEFPSGADGTA
jgi:hypothetical protein